jgi:hypothetical protein
MRSGSQSAFSGAEAAICLRESIDHDDTRRRTSGSPEQLLGGLVDAVGSAEQTLPPRAAVDGCLLKEALAYVAMNLGCVSLVARRLVDVFELGS